MLNFPISNLILQGPSNKLNLTENTQPAIFLVGYSIFQILKNEFDIDLNKAKVLRWTLFRRIFSLSVLWSIKFCKYIKDFEIQRKSNAKMLYQKGGMLAIIGSNYKYNRNLLNKKKRVNMNAIIANDNSNGQIGLKWWQ